MATKKFNFQSEKLIVDWISFKFQKLDDVRTMEIATYLSLLGFNSYSESGKLQQAPKIPIYVNEQMSKTVIFVQDSPYWSGTLLSFSGFNAKFFYQLIKDEKICWEVLSDGVLSRFDLYFSYRFRALKETEDIQQFFYDCQTKLKTNSSVERISQGDILRIGSRRSNRYSRIYQKNQTLRFEHEMKGNFLKPFSNLLVSNQLELFENKMSQSFYEYFGKKLPLKSKYLTWLIAKLRPFSNKSVSLLKLKTDYIQKEAFVNVKEKKNLIRFLQFLIYVKDLDFEREFLGKTAYRCVSFSLSDFLLFLNIQPNDYQFNILKTFIHDLQTDFIIKKFGNQYFQSLVSVPKVEIIKSGTKCFAKVWIVEDLFSYHYPFMFLNFLESRLEKYECLTISELIFLYSSKETEKFVDIKAFLESCNSLSNHNIKKIKQYFIKYTQLLSDYNLIENKFQLKEKDRFYDVSELNTRHISEGFFIFEKLNNFDE